PKENRNSGLELQILTNDLERPDEGQQVRMQLRGGQVKPTKHPGGKVAERQPKP
ncbi:hypothetical protein A2U01_0114548, partial [Trifolium medium]|nr:hypothetical protein [Trifolium medium]